MKEKLVGVQGVRDILLEKGIKMSYGKTFYLVKYHADFPKPVKVPGFKKPKWRAEDVEKWIDNFYKNAGEGEGDE